ncbi:MAG: DUF3332 domain-containing protein [Bacteroidaceae bacterium]|nr:DUF3332 domain-containing protein [Bacteroidaceae bacterium]
MKKISLKVAALMMAGSLLCTSCIGSYALFNKYEKWQCNMTKSKIVNGIVGLILQPICAPICLFVDCIVLNTIEFWSGSNPMSASIQTVKGSDGRLYTIRGNKTGYEVTDENGTVASFIHDAENDAWFIEQNGKKSELFRYNADGTISASLQGGSIVTVANNEMGLQMVREAATYDRNFAMK